MHPNIEKWLHELREGGHGQAKYRLMSPEGRMCCLGVYAKCVMGLEVPKVKHTDGDEDPDINGPIYDRVYESLKEASVPESTIPELIAANDDGVRFSTIASIIERAVSQ